MDIDIAQLAAQVGTILIPYLVKGGEAFAGETGKKMAESLWGKFKPKVEAKESMQDVIERLVRCALRIRDLPDYFSRVQGFRVVVSLA